MAFFTRRGASSVPEIPAAATNSNSLNSESQLSEEEAKKYSFMLDRDGVEV
jgi:hypothetical protein